MHNQRATSRVPAYHVAHDTLLSPLQDRNGRSRQFAYDHNGQYLLDNAFINCGQQCAASKLPDSTSKCQASNTFHEGSASKDLVDAFAARQSDSVTQKSSVRGQWHNERAVLQPLSVNTSRGIVYRHHGSPRGPTALRNEGFVSTNTSAPPQLPRKSPRKLLWPQASTPYPPLPQIDSRTFQSTNRSYHRPLLTGQVRPYQESPSSRYTEAPCPSTHYDKYYAAQKQAYRNVIFTDPFAGTHEKQHKLDQTLAHSSQGQEVSTSNDSSTSATVDASVEIADDKPGDSQSLPVQALLTDTSILGPGIPIQSNGLESRSSDDPTIEPKAPLPRQKIVEVRRLHKWQLLIFRIMFGGTIICTNISLLVVYFFTHHHLYLLAILVFMKSKDLLSTLIGAIGIILNALYYLIWPPPEVNKKWILSLVSVYAETDDQIWKTVSSLTNQKLMPHRQVICIIVDGKNAQVLTRFTQITHAFKRSYTTWKGAAGELVINAGFIGQTPVVFMRKMQNAGKKDSLILAHDLFNHPRKNMPPLTKEIRNDLNTSILPQLTQDATFSGFNGVFCTDADSTVHEDALKRLMDALARKKTAIAACGILVAELSVPRIEWSMWHLYQQFQYTFGQYVRRQAEGIWGRVTCLPGCITMIAVRPEMGPAIARYARPVTSLNVFEHQVQYLGTDRRLTWCMLSQSSKLTTLLVPNALCETVVPESLEHYLSQRRRWASNAYFNDYFYAFGREQRLITRLLALIDIVRQTLVFYRVINTALFLHSLITRFYILKITPTLVLTKTPATWFLVLALTTEPVLRKRLHKLLSGMCINQFISPILSVIVFANVLLNVGSQVWGRTGLSSLETRTDAAAPQMQQYLHMQHLQAMQQLEQLEREQQQQLQQQQHTPLPLSEQTWTPRRLGKIVQSAVRGFTSPRDETVGDSQNARDRTIARSPENVRQARVPATPGTSSAVFSPVSTRKRSPPSSAGTRG